MMLYPCDAIYCANISLPCLFSLRAQRHTCTPNTSNPNSIANVFENVLTATPPSKPIITSALAIPPPKVSSDPTTSPARSQRLLPPPHIRNTSSHIPTILPALICLYARGFGLPSLKTGTFASREYALKLSETVVNGVAPGPSHRRGVCR
ncbi:hypothetical protein HO173_000401 [Letharia columbiana]|uniref:Uncharacterized protein n=1 Tax=Letharia columbiana TaxID=112416 RepID=A0A8H6LAN8_9LECA|nr:uncharacterized protein HO173_000401 [Letharia columbiana]KAF6241690.1 hypothetical protein HO173_000401 [Letharia columbiana]